VREALCSALQARGAFLQAHVLDLFAGTGALGLEALSRGAADLVAVDRDRRSARCIRENAESLELADRTRVLELDLLGAADKVAAKLRAASRQPFTLVFVDPPYAHLAQALQLLPALWDRGLLADGAFVALEHDAKSSPERPPQLVEVGRYDYGDTSVALFQAIAIGGQT
jgi:16S rRNA (guanine966-N2)-methyltransferase